MIYILALIGLIMFGGLNVVAAEGKVVVLIHIVILTTLNQEHLAALKEYVPKTLHT